MSYESLTPLFFNGVGGSLVVDATLLDEMTTIALTDLGNGTLQIDGDGGFETVVFSGFDSWIVYTPEGVRLEESPRPEEPLPPRTSLEPFDLRWIPAEDTPAVRTCKKIDSRISHQQGPRSWGPQPAIPEVVSLRVLSIRDQWFEWLAMKSDRTVLVESPPSGRNGSESDEESLGDLADLLAEMVVDGGFTEDVESDLQYEDVVETLAQLV